MGTLGIVIVAAGKGLRMGTAISKQYMPLAGKPVLVHALETFQHMPEVEEMVLVLGQGETEIGKRYAAQYGLDKIVSVLEGGSERQHSVLRGLLALQSEWVLVHDGVRPFVTMERVRACWLAAQETGAAVLAVPVKDTIKQVNKAGLITATPDRQSLWAIQTPQAFRRSLLLEAHRRAETDGFVGTDDAMLAERIGAAVKIAEGDYSNIKITTPDDLVWGEAILRAREKGREQ